VVLAVGPTTLIEKDHIPKVYHLITYTMMSADCTYSAQVNG